MQRRTFLGTALAIANASPLFAALREERWDEAATVLERATAMKQVDAAVLHVVQRESLTRHFGKAASGDAMFYAGRSRACRSFLSALRRSAKICCL